MPLKFGLNALELPARQPGGTGLRRVSPPPSGGGGGGFLFLITMQRYDIEIAVYECLGKKVWVCVHFFRCPNAVCLILK